MILDTNAFSALAEGDPTIEPVLRQATQAAVPVIVLGEYRYGILQSHTRNKYQHWLSQYLPQFRILDIDENTTNFYAEIRIELKKIGKPIPSNDVWIAALGRQHCLPILSRDLHFDAVAGITRLAW